MRRNLGVTLKAAPGKKVNFEDEDKEEEESDKGGEKRILQKH